jgi:hypothetical protein
MARARNGNWASVGVRLARITSQLFHGLEATPGGTDVAAERSWVDRLIADCALAHSLDSFRLLGLNSKAVDVVR